MNGGDVWTSADVLARGVACTRRTHILRAVPAQRSQKAVTRRVARTDGATHRLPRTPPRALPSAHEYVGAWASPSRATDVFAPGGNRPYIWPARAVGAAPRGRSRGPNTRAGWIRSSAPRTDSAMGWKDLRQLRRYPCWRHGGGRISIDRIAIPQEPSRRQSARWPELPWVDLLSPAGARPGTRSRPQCLQTLAAS
jgi:hypothetical protein